MLGITMHYELCTLHLKTSERSYFMKKLISLLLALAMILTLGVPALAAEPTVNGKKEGDVKATYTPVITISDIVLSGDAVTVDQKNRTYTITIPADADSTIITITVSGQNLDKATENYNVAGMGCNFPLTEDYFEYDSDTGNLITSVYILATDIGDSLEYTTDGGNTWTKTGWSVVIRQAEPVPTYSVAIPESEEDILSVDKTTAAEDETVTVTVAAIPDGYRLDYVNVYMEGGGFPATKQDDGTYTFTMPDCDVTVRPQLTKIYDIKVDAIENGTVTADVAKAACWETVTLNVAAAQGYQLEKLTVTNDTTGDEVEVSEKHSFTMPDSSVTVTASFVAAAKTYEVIIGATTGGTVTADKAHYAQGDTVTLTVTTVGDYQLRSLQYTDDQGNVTGISGSTFIMPASDVTVTAVFYKPAAITGLVLVVDGTDYTSGTVTLDADSTAIVKAVGTDLNNADYRNQVYLGVADEYLTDFTLDESNTFATAPLYLSNYSKGYAYELKYKNDGGSEWICPGLFFKIAVEAKWGASKDNLTHAGTLADAFAAAQADNSIAYIQLQQDVTADSEYNLESGAFTFDLNGKKLSSTQYTINVEKEATVTFTDSATGGSMEMKDDVCVCVVDGGKVVIEGGSYSGTNGAQVGEGGTLQIEGGSFKSSIGIANTGGKLTINDGDFTDTYNAVYADGETTVNGGSFTTEKWDVFYYVSGLLDLSGYQGTVTGLTLCNDGESDLVVTDEVIRLPAGYVLVDGQGNAVTTLVLYETYTIAAEVVKYTVSVNAAQNGAVTADKETAAQGDTVTLTWTTEGKYALENITVKDADGNEVTITGKGLTAWTFTMPASDVTVSAAFKEVLTTSADISWGSLSFTYTDGENGAEGAWSNDGTEGAGTVTVKNTGDNTFIAQPVYTAETDYDEIACRFYHSADPESPTSMGVALDSSETATFILKLFNKPEKVIRAGTKIGTVTIRITEGALG